MALKNVEPTYVCDQCTKEAQGDDARGWFIVGTVYRPIRANADGLINLLNQHPNVPDQHFCSLKCLSRWSNPGY